MDAVVIYEHGGPEKLTPARVDVPVAMPGETLIRVRASGIEPGLDARTRQNAARWQLTMPHVLGASFAGEVVEGPDPDMPPAGTRVAVAPTVACLVCDFCRSGHDNSCRDKRIMGVHRWGGYAEFATVPTRNLIPITDRTSFEAAAATVTSFATAWNMVVTRGRVQPTDTVLIVGAAGSVGIASAQIAALYGARVILAGRSRSKLEGIAAQVGALGIVNTSEGLTDQLAELAPGGIDLVVETVGASTWAASISVLRSEGRIVCCGASSGWEVSMSLRDLYRANLSIMCSAAGTFEDLRRVLSLVGSGRLVPVIHRTYPLLQAVQAHHDLMTQQHIGKLVLIPG